MKVSELVARLQEYGETGNLECMDSALIRLVRAAKDEGRLSLEDVVTIVTEELALDGE